MNEQSKATEAVEPSGDSQAALLRHYNTALLNITFCELGFRLRS